MNTSSSLTSTPFIQAQKKRRRLHTPETLLEAFKGEPQLVAGYVEGDYKFVEYEENGVNYNCFVCLLCVSSLDLIGGDLSPIRTHLFGRPGSDANPKHHTLAARRIAGTLDRR